MIRKCLIVGLGLGALNPGALIPSLRAEGRLVRSVVKADQQTGRLIRRTIVTQPADSTASSTPVETQELTELIDSIASRNAVEAPLVHSVIQTESNYNPLAISNKGAQGLMQLIPSTARRFGVKDSFDTTENVEGGTKYLKYLIDLYHGDYTLAVAAYNAGEAAVTKYGGVPPYRETQNYVAQVAKRLQARRKNVVNTVSTEPIGLGTREDAKEETYNPVIASVGSDGRVYYRTP